MNETNKPQNGAKSTESVNEEQYEGWRQSSTCRAVEDLGAREGREYALAESKASTFANLLGRQAKRKFGTADPDGKAALNGLRAALAGEQLEALADRLLEATSWADWLNDVKAPPPAPALPDFTKNLEMDFEKSGPSIDTYMKAKMATGPDCIFHLCLQKWYQPDLDRFLYEESLRVERKQGKMPIVAVILLWPKADGPGMTGRFEDRDAKGKVKRTFNYTIRRAWEIEVEELVKSMGTMAFATLGKNSRERMPDVVRMIKDSLEKLKPERDMLETIWATAYWSMGLLCELDDCHRYLGDVFSIIENCQHYKGARGHAFMGAYTSVQHEEGPLTAVRALIERQATRRFGPSPDAKTALDAIDSLEQLEEVALRVLTAGNWNELLAKG